MTVKKAIYLTSSGKLKREADTLCFLTEKSKRFVPITTVGSIHVFGELDLNKRVLEFLARNQVSLHFYNYYGFYIGTFYPREHYNSGFMILRQAEHYLDPNRRQLLATSFVNGAINNLIRVLKYYRSRGYDALDTQIQELEATLPTVVEAQNADELRAIEGNARKIYYSAFNEILRDHSHFQFTRRERRPPTTPLNSLISFGNSLLYTAILSEIYKTHLDPRIGYLHETNFRRFTLNLDIAEIFKPPIVDRVIFTLINKGELQPKHFMKELDGVFLNDRGRTIFLTRYEEKLNTTVKISSDSRRKASYRRLLRIELYKIERHLMGDKQYEPYTSRW